MTLKKNYQQNLVNLTRVELMLNFVSEQLEQADVFFGHGTDNAWDEAITLVLPILNLSVHSGEEVLTIEVPEEKRVEILDLLEKRIDEKIPVAYLTHQAYFAGLEFYVDERVLIPRSPIAELIAQRFQPWLIEQSKPAILDLCTGGGCIAIACAYAFPEASVDAIDISKDALDVAKQNIEKHQVENKVKLIQSDLFEKLPQDKKYDLIVTNPPYVDAEDMADLPAEYCHEPGLGLAAGEDGLELVDTILKRAKQHLTAKGVLIVEVGNSAGALMAKYPDYPFIWLEFAQSGDGVFLLFAEDLTLGSH